MKSLKRAGISWNPWFHIFPATYTRTLSCSHPHWQNQTLINYIIGYSVYSLCHPGYLQYGHDRLEYNIFNSDARLPTDIYVLVFIYFIGLGWPKLFSFSRYWPPPAWSCYAIASARHRKNVLVTKARRPRLSMCLPMKFLKTVYTSI